MSEVKNHQAAGSGGEDLPASGAGGGETDVGARLRSLRERYGLSQRELARRAGVANATISHIEQNRVSPSVSSLRKVLTGFPVSLSQFFAEDPQRQEEIFYRADELIEIGGNRISLRQLGRKSPDRALQVLHERYEPGGDTGSTMISHEGEEAGIVVLGEIEITVGGRTKTLSAGDGYYFESRLPHRFRNCGAKPCEIVSVCTPASF